MDVLLVARLDTPARSVWSIIGPPWKNKGKEESSYEGKGKVYTGNSQKWDKRRGTGGYTKAAMYREVVKLSQMKELQLL